MDTKNTPLVSDEQIAYYRLGAALNITKRDDDGIMDAAEGGANAVRALYEADRSKLLDTVQVLVDAGKALYDRWNRTGGIAPVFKKEELDAMLAGIERAKDHHNITPSN